MSIPPPTSGINVRAEHVPGLLEDLKNGHRWCHGCGLPKVAPDAPAGVITCPACTESKAAGKWCIRCGTQIDRNTIDWFEREKRAAPQYCSLCHPRSRWPRHCKECPLVHPDHWHTMKPL